MNDDIKNLEDKVNGKRFSFSVKDMKWIITLVIFIVGWGITAYLWVSDKSNMKEEIITLQGENTNLNEKVLRLEGQVEGVNNAANIFMENSPSENRYRIEKLEERVAVLELPGSNPPPRTNVSHTDTSVVLTRTNPVSVN